MQEEAAEPNNYPLNVDSDSLEYDVEQILDRRVHGKDYAYLIRWAGYPNPKDYTWEPVEHLGKVKKMVNEFNAKMSKNTANKIIKLRKKPKMNRSASAEGSSKKSSSLDQESSPSQKRLRDRQKQGKNNKFKKLAAKKKTQKKKEKIETSFKPNIIKTNTEKQVNSYLPKVIPAPSQKAWERQGRSLGRIHSHFYRSGQIVFHINVNQDDVVCGTAYLTLGDLMADYEEKVVEYMENWCKNSLISEEERKTQDCQTFEKFWNEVQ